MRLLQIFLMIILLAPGLNAVAQDSIFDTSAIDNVLSNDDEFLPVDEAFRFDFNQQGDSVEIYFAIEEGYYLYRDKLVFKTLDAEHQAPNLPQGIDHEDEYFGIQQVYYNQVKFNVPLTSVGGNGELTMTFQGCAEKGLCYPPTKKVIPLDKISGNDTAALISAIAPSTTNGSTKAVSEQDQLASSLADDSLFIVLLSFLGLGVLLSFTPCVFPMYPILTGIIVGQGKQLTTKKAFGLSFAYVQGMAITYTLLGIVVALAGAQFQAAFQHPAVLIVLSVVFILLALSMFGGIQLSVAIILAK